MNKTNYSEHLGLLSLYIYSVPVFMMTLMFVALHAEKQCLLFGRGGISVCVAG